MFGRVQIKSRQDPSCPVYLWDSVNSWRTCGVEKQIAYRVLFGTQTSSETKWVGDWSVGKRRIEHPSDRMVGWRQEVARMAQPRYLGLQKPWIVSVLEEENPASTKEDVEAVATGLESGADFKKSETFANAASGRPGLVPSPVEPSQGVFKPQRCA